MVIACRPGSLRPRLEPGLDRPMLLCDALERLLKIVDFHPDQGRVDHEILPADETIIDAAAKDRLGVARATSGIGSVGSRDEISIWSYVQSSSSLQLVGLPPASSMKTRRGRFGRTKIAPSGYWH